MTILKHYVGSADMRASYYRLNNIKHLEAWTDDNGASYYPALCCSSSVGLPERSDSFPNPEAVATWGRLYCPELEFVAHES